MAGGQQITVAQGSVGKSLTIALTGQQLSISQGLVAPVGASGPVSIALTGNQIAAVAGDVARENVIEDTFITAIAGTAKASFAIPLIPKQSKPGGTT